MIYRTEVFTHHEILSIMISFDSTLAVALLKESDSRFIVRLYGLNQQTFTEEIIEGTFLKA